jgi:hypothetical protein
MSGSQGSVASNQHREEYGEEMLAPVRRGEAQVLTREKIDERLKASGRQPVYLKREVQDALVAAAERKGITLGELVNDLLAKDLAIAEIVK